VYLALHLAFEVKSNDKSVWRAIEEAALKCMHLFTVTEMCQLEWATSQLKPKQTTARMNTLLLAEILDKLYSCNAHEIMHIMQGFRSKQNKNLYQKIRQLLIDQKQTFDLKGADLINMMYMFASFRPKTFGVYRIYAEEELNEMLAHYEHALCEAAEEADPEQVTRLAQALYVLKTD
jgi:hypothetical protein